MASFTFTDCRLELNSVVMSSYATKVTLKVDVDDQESTTFGKTYKTRLGGLKDWSVDVDWVADFANSAVDQTIWPLLGTVVTIKVRPTTSAISVTNPEYSGTVLISEYTPLDGSVGDLAALSTSWPGSDTLSRATA